MRTESQSLDEYFKKQHELRLCRERRDNERNYERALKRDGPRKPDQARRQPRRHKSDNSCLRADRRAESMKIILQSAHRHQRVFKGPSNRADSEVRNCHTERCSPRRSSSRKGSSTHAKKREISQNSKELDEEDKHEQEHHPSHNGAATRKVVSRRRDSLQLKKEKSRRDMGQHLQSFRTVSRSVRSSKSSKRRASSSKKSPRRTTSDRIRYKLRPPSGDLMDMRMPATDPTESCESESELDMDDHHHEEANRSRELPLRAPSNDGMSPMIGSLAKTPRKKKFSLTPKYMLQKSRSTKDMNYQAFADIPDPDLDSLL